MNRRGFLKGVAVAVFCTATRIYALAAPVPVLERTLTLAEWAGEHDVEGSATNRIIAQLVARHDIMEDVCFVSGDPTAFRTTIRTKLPEVAWSN